MQPLDICLIQTSTHWHDPAANRAMFASQIDQLSQSVDLIVLPEMWSTGFTMASGEVAETMSGESLAWMKTYAAQTGSVICGSLVIEEAGKYFNRFCWVMPSGEVTAYDKRHLFRMAGEHEHYAVGGEKITVELKGWRICPMVCYDLRFPVWFRNQHLGHGEMAYDLLLTVACWPAPRRLAWNSLLRARAIENQVFSVGLNLVGVDGNGVPYSGGTAIYGPTGEAQVELFDTAAVHIERIDKEALLALRSDFPVWQDADAFSFNSET